MVATLLGAVIGLEREQHGRPAGLRTHILVALGSCLIMLVSIYGFPSGTGSDPARLAAQVVSGIGFLGAGTILRDGTSIRGLTTAASLWVVAGIGLAAGTGFYWAAAIT
ncbi:MAG TPA: methyltransferase, partial [Firmicutes bacterium]|nr:methyltransferase [Bacillota bacterium]